MRHGFTRAAVALALGALTLAPAASTGAASAATVAAPSAVQAAATPVLTVTPATDLVPGQTVTFSGTGFAARVPYILARCRTGAVDTADCDLAAPAAETTAEGVLSTRLSVQRTIVLGNRRIDCAITAGGCEYAAVAVQRRHAHCCERARAVRSPGAPADSDGHREPTRGPGERPVGPGDRVRLPRRRRRRERVPGGGPGVLEQWHQLRHLGWRLRRDHRCARAGVRCRRPPDELSRDRLCRPGEYLGILRLRGGRTDHVRRRPSGAAAPVDHRHSARRPPPRPAGAGHRDGLRSELHRAPRRVPGRCLAAVSAAPDDRPRRRRPAPSRRRCPWVGSSSPTTTSLRSRSARRPRTASRSAASYAPRARWIRIASR